MSKKITLLGSTGSIGTQSLDVIRAQGYEVFGLSAHSQTDKILQQIEEFHPKYVCMTGEAGAEKLSAALAGRADAGLVRTGLLEELAAEGRLRLDDISVMRLPGSPPATLPWRITTDLYPEWPLVALAGVDAALAKRVAVALLQLPHDAPAVQAMGIHGFTIPADYSAIRQLLVTLRLPPFDQGPEFTLEDIWRRYALPVLLGAGARHSATSV